LFRYCKSVIDFDAEIADCAFDLRMTKQKQDSPQVTRAPLDEGSFGAAQGMRPKQSGVQSDAADPLGDEPCILASCQATGRAAMAGEQKLAGSFAGGL
jgi:hypothetical protein